MPTERFIPGRRSHPIIDGAVAVGGSWWVFDSSFASYEVDFRKVDRDQKLPAFIEKLRGEPEPIVVDLLSSPAALRSLKSERGLSRMKGIAVGLADSRTDEEIREDTANNIHFVAGRLEDSKTWEDLKELLGDRKVNLFLERGHGGLEDTPFSRNLYSTFINRIWDNLDPDLNLAALEIPPLKAFTSARIPIKSWLRKLERRNIYLRYLEKYSPYQLSSHEEFTYGLLLFEKNPNIVSLPDCRRYVL
jgi:hypothetical protein